MNVKRHLLLAALALGSYLRIDGPWVWIELSVQGGVIIRGETHYHSVYHDRTHDYGGQF